MRKKILALLLASLMLTAFLAACVGAGEGTAAPPTAPAENVGQVFNMRLNHGGSEATLIHQAVEHFAMQAYELSDGQLNIEIFPNAALGPEATTIEAVQTGDIEFTPVNTGALVSFVPEFGIWAVPFAFPDLQTAYNVLDGEFGQRMSGLLESQGFIGLGYVNSMDFRQTTSNNPIHSLDDLQGMRIRVLDNPIQIAIWQALGTAPTPIPFAELYTALQQGTVDGMENPLEMIVAMRFYEVQSNIALTNHLFQTGQLLMSARVFNELPSDLQEVIRESARRAVDYQRVRAAELEDELISHLEAAGVEVTHLDEAEMERFRESAQEAVDFIRGQVGSDLVDDLFAAIDAAR